MHYIFLHLLDNIVFYLVIIFTLLHHNLRHCDVYVKLPGRMS